MPPLPPATRRANLWLFVALVGFAIALSVACFFWMRGVVRANGGIVDPQKKKTSLLVPRAPSPAADFALRPAWPCLT